MDKGYKDNNMKLYALQRDEGYDGDVFIGIYESKEKAKQSLGAEFLKNERKWIEEQENDNFKEELLSVVIETVRIGWSREFFKVSLLYNSEVRATSLYYFIEEVELNKPKHKEEIF